MPTPASAEDNVRYIFEEPAMAGGTRWGWLVDCLQGDIRTFLDGMAICYPIRDRLQATKNVQGFLKQFFAGAAAKITWVFWAAVRNGLVHAFRPTHLLCDGVRVHFVFYQERFPSFLERVSGTQARLHASVPDLFAALRSATSRYGERLWAEERLQENFREAWEALADYEREVRDTAERKAFSDLFTALTDGYGTGLFQDDVSVIPDGADQSARHYVIREQPVYVVASVGLGTDPLASYGTASCTSAGLRVPRNPQGKT